MTTYRYRIFHDDEECSKQELIRPALNPDQLRHEYENIDTALHLYSRARGLEVSYAAEVPEPGGVVISFRSFATAEEAETFVLQFINWLQNKVSIRFCPAVQSIKD